MILTILLLILLKEIFLAGLIPLWQNNDEIEHFAYTYYLVEEGEMPVAASVTNHSVLSQSEELAEANKIMQSDDISQSVFIKNQIIHQNFNQTVSKDAFTKKTTNLSRKNNDEKYHNPAAVYPPLYSYVLVPPYKIFQNQSIITRAYAMRIFSILFMLITVLYSFKLALLFFKGKAAPYTVAILIGFLPRFSFTSTGINNDALVIAISTVAIYYLFKLLNEKINWQKIIILGTIFGVGLLSKPQFYIFFVFLLIFFIYKSVKTKKITTHLFSLLIIVLIAVIISSSWFLFTYANRGSSPTQQITGTLALDNDDVGGLDITQTTRYILLRYLFLTSSYFHMTGCCHEITTLAIFQGLFFITLIAGFFGFMLYIFEKKKIFKNFKIFFLFFIPLLLELSYLLIYLRQPLATGTVDFPIDGRYLYPVISCLTIILIIGLFNITPKKIHKFILITLFGGIIIINTYHIIFEIIPRYYL